jgi:hypothetical protein
LWCAKVRNTSEIAKQFEEKDAKILIIDEKSLKNLVITKIISTFAPAYKK